MTAPLDAADQLFRSLDREAWVVTAGKPNSGERGGLLATWVMQVSLAPSHPTLLLGIAPNHHTAEVIDRDGGAAAHLLRTDQAELGLAFADGSGRDRDKFATAPVAESPTISDAERPVACNWAPVFTDCFGWMAGPVTARLDAGDRIFYWIQVQQSEYYGGDGPLRQSQLLGSASPEQRERLMADRQRDMELQAPLREQWCSRVRSGGSQVRPPG